VRKDGVSARNGPRTLPCHPAPQLEVQLRLTRRGTRPRPPAAKWQGIQGVHPGRLTKGLQVRRSARRVTSGQPELRELLLNMISVLIRTTLDSDEVGRRSTSSARSVAMEETHNREGALREVLHQGVRREGRDRVGRAAKTTLGILAALVYALAGLPRRLKVRRRGIVHLVVILLVIIIILLVLIALGLFVI